MESRKKPNAGLESCSAYLGAIQEGKVPAEKLARPGAAEEPSAVETKIAARVLAKFRVIFPHFAAKVMDDEQMLSLMVYEWANALRGADPEKIKLALERLRDSGKTWPPSLPEFVAMCKPKMAACHQPFLPAPKKKVNKEVANRHLNELRAILRRKN